MLDSDLAARSASLGRIYNDLGFQQLGLVEGWKSVNTDPANFSAHRFLADSYAVLPRHEIARVSELLQSQLLQPINITPIQPRLAESNLFLISAGGPTTVSFNEFNPLFTRDRLALQVTGLGGEQNTWAGEGVLSGLYRNASFSLGGSHFTTDGFRKNADQGDNLANAFVQLELSPQTSLQAEYRYRKIEHGDLRLRFFPEIFFPNERNTEERYTYRLGGRHAFSPGSILLASFTYQDADFRLRDVDPGISLRDLKSPQHAFGSELQQLFRSRYVNVVGGAGYFDINGRIDATEGSGQITVQSTTKTDIEHTNIYVYSYIDLLKNITFTIGASGDFTSGESPDIRDKRELNPKFGITWSPLFNTTLRAAAFRVFKRTLITDQTLEPTQVAGFNQFFDDIDGTEAWRYGAAIDQKFTKNIFGGVEFSKRDLKEKHFVSSTEVTEVDSNEYLGRTYLFWTPYSWLALRAEYLFERFRQEGFELDTYRVPLGVRFFQPFGWTASLTATYWNQDVKLGDSLSGRDEFWIVDAGISYRLPKRYGFITVGSTNLFDKKFNYFNIDIKNPIIQPTRTLFLRVTLALP